MNFQWITKIGAGQGEKVIRGFWGPNKLITDHWKQTSNQKPHERWMLINKSKPKQKLILQSVSSHWFFLGRSQKVVKHGQEATVACVPFSLFLFHSLSLSGVFLFLCLSLFLSLSLSLSLGRIRLRAIYITLAGLQARADYNTLAPPFTSDPSASQPSWVWLKYYESLTRIGTNAPRIM